MQVRALQSFADESGRHSVGDVFEMADTVAVVRIRAGLVQRAADRPETATAPKAETATTRRGRE